MYVTKMVWGEVQTSDGSKWKDAIISFNQGQPSVRSWDWTADGTRHNPGITVTALQHIMNCDVIILSQGYHHALNVTPAALSVLKNSGKQYYIMQSEEAVQNYNALAKKGKSVGILLHTTC